MLYVKSHIKTLTNILSCIEMDIPLSQNVKKWSSILGMSLYRVCIKILEFWNAYSGDFLFLSLFNISHFFTSFNSEIWGIL